MVSPFWDWRTANPSLWIRGLPIFQQFGYKLRRQRYDVPGILGLDIGCAQPVPRHREIKEFLAPSDSEAQDLKPIEPHLLAPPPKRWAGPSSLNATIKFSGGKAHRPQLK